MKRLNELRLLWTPWSVECSRQSKAAKVFDVKNSCGQTLCGGLQEPVARMMAESPEMYDRACRLVWELDKVLDTDSNGNWIIASECSFIVFALEELKESLESVSNNRVAKAALVKEAGEEAK